MSSPETIIEKSLVNHLNEIIIKNNPNSKHYRKHEILGKSYIFSTKIKYLEIRRNLYYYCVNHRTTKTIETPTENWNKKRINICNGRIKYDKNLGQYCLLENHSKKMKRFEKGIPN